MIDISNVNKESRQFGIFTVTEMDDVPFMSYVDEFNEEYVFHENTFIEFSDLFTDPSKLNFIKRDMTFDEAVKELTRLMNEFFEKNSSDDEEGDQYHTIDVDPNANDEASDDLGENGDKEYDTRYEGTMNQITISISPISHVKIVKRCLRCVKVSMIWHLNGIPET